MTTPIFHDVPPVRVALVPVMADLYRRRRPEPVRIDIDPLPAEHLEVLRPGSSPAGAPVRAAVTVRDIYDNRVDYQKPLTMLQ